MGMTSSFISLALCATTSLMAFHSNSKEYITYSDQNVKAITSSVEQKKASQIEKLTKEMLLITQQFHQKVLLYSNKYIYNWNKQNSSKVGEYLAILTSHIDDKKEFYKQLYKRHKDFSLNKTTRNTIKEILTLLDAMRNQIQIYINLTYKGIDAKHSFLALQKIVQSNHIEISLADYWYSDDLEDDILFLVSDSLSDDSIDLIFDIEDRLTNELNNLAARKKDMPKIKLPKIASFDFNALNRQYFYRVSFL
jgi:hypothetical protein